MIDGIISYYHHGKERKGKERNGMEWKRLPYLDAIGLQMELHLDGGNQSNLSLLLGHTYRFRFDKSSCSKRSSAAACTKQKNKNKKVLSKFSFGCEPNQARPSLQLADCKETETQRAKNPAILACPHSKAMKGIVPRAER